jgi:hypothetical protein
MSPDDLIALLGRHHTDPLVEAALRHYVVRNRPEVEIDHDDPDGPVVQTQSWVKNSRVGIEFGFQDEAAWLGLDKTELGKRAMVLIQIYLYGRHEGVRPYKGQLPFGLQLSDDKATVRRKLARFESTRHSWICDTWDTPDFRITVGYADDGTCIEAVICILREPPLPALGYGLQPVPALQTLVGLFGRALDDTAVHHVFDPFGLQAQIDQIRNAGEADFQYPFGFALEFLLPDSTATAGADDDILLSGVTFYDDRELGARRWPGDLPYGIRFGDSMETVVQKLGRTPDSESYDLISGRALWAEPALTVSIFYDTTENRTLRVRALAPMIIRVRRTA